MRIPMRLKRVIAIAVLGLLLSPLPTLAHHSFSAMYDVKKYVVLNGTLTEVMFRNPHIWVFIDVPGDGSSVNWGCEGANPNSLFRRGWRPEWLKVGESVTMEGYAARNGKPLCNLRNLVTADGKKMFVGAVDDGAPAVPTP